MYRLLGGAVRPQAEFGAYGYLTTAVTMFREMHMGFWLAEAEAALTGAGEP